MRRGEMLWNDGTMCFQHWQSCASCHPEGRMDALNAAVYDMSQRFRGLNRIVAGMGTDVDEMARRIP